MAQYTTGWSVNAGADTITFFIAPANGADIVVQEFDPLLFRGTDIWALGAWSEFNGYPAEVEFFGDRLVFARTEAKPQTMWMSQVGDYPNFGVSSPIVDSDAITVTFNARKLNVIQDLIALEKPLMMTSSGEWRVTGGANNDVLTPASVGFAPQSYHGSSRVPAVIVGDSAVFVQDRGFILRDLWNQISTDITAYKGNDLRIFASHLTEGKAIRELAFQKIPYSIVWVLREDGVLCAMTYLREQEILAWTPQEIDGVVESICCIPEGDEDALYMVVRREIEGNQKRFTERLAKRVLDKREDDEPEVRTCKFLDCALTFDGRNTTPTTLTATGATYGVDDVVNIEASDDAFDADDVGDVLVLGYNANTNIRLEILSYVSPTEVTAQVHTAVPASLQATATLDWAFARNTMAGLEHLEGRTVGILADGFAPPQQVVEDGEIELEQHAALVHIGLPYVSDFESLDLAIAGAQTIRMKAKNIKRLGVVVEETRSIKYGPDFDNLDEYEPRQDEGYADTPRLLNELHELWITSEWAVNGRVCIRQDDPLPMAILALVPDFETGT